MKVPESIVTLEDCMQMMGRYPDKFFELAIVDPPYGINAANYERGGTQDGNSAAQCKVYEKKDWDKSAPENIYFNELLRVSKNQIVWGANHFISEMPLNSPCWIVWDKDNGDNGYADCELAWTSFDTAVRKIKWKWHGMLQQDMKNKEDRIHPTQKPVALYKWILQNYAMCKKCNNSGIIQEAIGEKWMGTQDVDCEYCDVAVNGRPKILDTHLGSGSSRIAAYLMGFDFYGCEIDKDYFEAQEKRFKEQTAQGSLFDYKEAI